MRLVNDFFEFEDNPFKRTPDVEFYYGGAMYQVASECLVAFFHSGSPYAALVGEKGTGKTTVAKKVISELPQGFVAGYVKGYNFSFSDFLELLGQSVGLPPKASQNNEKLAKDFEKYLSDLKEKDKCFLLFIDDADLLSLETLQEIVEFSQRLSRPNIIKTIFIGDVGFDLLLKKVSEPFIGLEPITVANISNLCEPEIREYINTHLARAGRSPLKISGKVIRKVGKITKGNPLLINILMERVIISAFLDNTYSINENHLTSAVSSVNNIRSVARSKGGSPFGFIFAAGVLLVGAFFIYSSQVSYLKEAVFSKFSSVKSGSVSENISDNKQTPPDTLIQKDLENKPLTPSNSQIVTDETQKQIVKEEAAPARNAEAVNAVAGSKTEDKKVAEEPIRVEEAKPLVNQRKPSLDLPDRGLEGVSLKAGSVVVVSGTSLNVRKEPSLDSEKVASVVNGDRLTVLEDTAGWIKIDVGGGSFGWVYKRYLKAE